MTSSIPSNLLNLNDHNFAVFGTKTLTLSKIPCLDRVFDVMNCFFADVASKPGTIV